MIAGKTKAGTIFNAVNISLLTFLGIVFVLPYLLILIASITSENSFYLHGYTFFPKEISFEAYVILFTSNNEIYTGFYNSVLITVLGTFITTSVTVLLSYSLSKPYIRGKKFLNVLLIVSMLFSGGLIPTYMLIQQLRMINTYWAIVLPGMTSPWNCLMMRTYFKNIPDSLEEASKVDGASPLRILFSIYLPLAVPMLATIMLFTAVGFWNQWSASVLYFDTSRFRHMMPLTVILRERIQKNLSPSGSGGMVSVQENVKMATAVVATLPIIMVYPFVQRYFISGMMIGSVKG